MDFASLDLPEPVMQGIRQAGFAATTPIQEAALPLALKGKDVAGQSQTGTGKTAAFLITGFTRLLRAPEPASGEGTAPRMLIIAPTRELVVQIEADARLLGAHTRSASSPSTAASTTLASATRWRRAATSWWGRRAGSSIT